MPLPQLALERMDGRPISPQDLAQVSQTLDLWTGVVTSAFTLDGQTVNVSVAAHPKEDVLAVRIESPLLRGKLGVSVTLPRGHDKKTKNNPPLDWGEPESHTTSIASQTDRALDLVHTRDSVYFARFTSVVPIRIERTGAHAFRLSTANQGELEFTAAFGPTNPSSVPTAEQVRAGSRAYWPKFWSSGAAIDFTGSKDPRARELERHQA